MNLKKYFLLTKNALITGLVFRVHFFFQIIGSIFTVTIAFFLWKAIFISSGQQVLRGMTFEQTFVYISLATCLFVMFRTWIDWFIGRDIMSGNIIMHFFKPVGYFSTMLFRTMGFALCNLLFISIPSFLVILFVFKADIGLGLNIPFFITAVILAFFISYLFDFTIGLTAFFTESIWGINMTKEVIVLLLAGAVVPLPFFPEEIQGILELLPFRAIYHIPLTILTSHTLGIEDYLKFIAIQLFWIALLFPLAKLYFSQARKVLTVNGG